MNHFLIYYFAIDDKRLRSFSLRMLSKERMSNDISLTDTHFFKSAGDDAVRNIIYRLKDPKRFSIFEPIGGTPGEFDFESTRHLGSSILDVGTAHEFFTKRIHHSEKLFDFMMDLSEQGKGRSSLTITNTHMLTFSIKPFPTEGV